MKAIKRHLATVLAAIMIFTTIGNAYVSAKASGDTLDSIGEGADSHEIVVTDPGEEVPPADTEENIPPVAEEEVPPATKEEDVPPVTEEEVPPVSEEEQPPVIEEEQPPVDEDLPPVDDEEKPDDGTEVVNEDASVIVVKYDAGVGGKVDYESEKFYSDDDQINLYGAEAIPESGYIFKNWIREETGEVVSEQNIFIPDSEEIEWILGHTADAGGEIEVTYTAQFVAVASEYEKEIPNSIYINIQVSEGAFDEEVELVVKELSQNSKEHQEAEQALEDAGIEYEAAMSYDIHFDSVETGEEVQPQGPVKMEYEILKRKITRTINSTEGLDEVTTESQIQMHHLEKVEDARTGETELVVTTIADTELADANIVQNDDLEDPDAGLNRYGEQETVGMDVSTDKDGNVTGASGDVVINGFSIFTFTVTSGNTAGAGTYKVPNVRIVENNGDFNKANYQNAAYTTGTAYFTKDGQGSRLTSLESADGKSVEFDSVYWVQGNNWNGPIREVTDWNLKLSNNGANFVVNPVTNPAVNWDIIMYNSANTSEQYGDQYYFIKSPDTTVDGIKAYVYKKGTGAGQISINGVSYVPASPKVTSVTFAGRSAFLKDFASFASIYRKTKNGYAQVKRINSSYSDESGWITMVTEDDNADHRYVRISTNEDSTKEYVWLLEDDNSILEGEQLPTGIIYANIYLLLNAVYSPDPLHKGYNMGLFGPATNNTEYFKVKINLDELNKLMTPEVRYYGGSWNGPVYEYGPQKGEETIHYYYSYQSHAASNPDSPYRDIESTSKNGKDAKDIEQAKEATKYAREFFDNVLLDEKVMPDPADRAKFKEVFGETKLKKPNFVGYVLKREADYYNKESLKHDRGWHIDGMIREFPYYLLQLFEAAGPNDIPDTYSAPFATHSSKVPDQYYGYRVDEDPTTEDEILVEQVAINMFEKYFRKKYGDNINITWDYSPKDRDDNSIDVGTIYHGVITKGDKTIQFNIAPMPDRQNGRKQTHSGVKQGGEITYENIVQDQVWLSQFKVWFTEKDTGSIKVIKNVAGSGKSIANGMEFQFKVFKVTGGEAVYVTDRGNNVYIATDKETEGATDTVTLTMPRNTDTASLVIYGLDPDTDYRIEELRDFIDDIPADLGITFTKVETSPAAAMGDNYGKHGRVTVKKDQTAEVTFTNWFEKETGTLELSKTFTGDATAIEEAKKTVRFTIYQGVNEKAPVLEHDGKTYKDLTYADLGAKAKLTLTGLATGPYTVVETGADGGTLATVYTVTTTVTSTSGKKSGNDRSATEELKAKGTISFAFTNDYKRKTIDIKGTKIWQDEQNAENKRPATIRVRLAAYVEDANGTEEINGKKYTRLTTLAGAEANKYTNTYPLKADQTADYMTKETWDNLYFAADTLNGIPEYTEDGKKITYRLIEMDAADRNREITVDAETGYGVFDNLYKVTYSEDGMTITNRLDSSLDPFSGGDLGENVPGHMKYIEKSPSAAEWDGTYDLTLTVEGTKGSEEEKAKVDILFISDFSGSMGAYTMGDGTTGARLDKLKAVLEDLLETVGENDNIDARFAMVGFDGKITPSNATYDTATFDDAYPVVNWTEVNTAAQRRNFVGEVEKYRKTIAGTNYQAGFREGITMLNNKPNERKGTQTYVIFISDGNPTFWYDKYGRTQGTGLETASNIKSSYDEMIDWPEQITTNYFYSILVGPDATAFNTKKTSDVLKDINGKVKAKDGKQFFHANNTTNLEKAFSDIGKAITTIEVSKVTIKDTLHSNADFVPGNAALLIEVYNDQGVKIADSSANGKGRPDKQTSVTFNDGVTNVTMNLVRGDRDFTLTFNPTTYKLRPGYSYRITAHVEPSDLAYKNYVSNKNNYPDDEVGEAGTHEHAGTTGYYSNDYGKTYLTYDMDGSKTVPYPKPVMRLDTVNYSVEKKFANTPKELMPDTVQLQIFEQGKNTPLQTLTLGAATQWKGTFEGLRKWKSGKQLNYVIKEVGETNGSVTLEASNGNEVTFTVDYGTVNGNADAGYNQIITNTLSKGSLTLKKTVAYDESVTAMSDADKALIQKALTDYLTFTIYKNGQGEPYRTVRYSDMTGTGLERTFTLSDVEPGKYSVVESAGAQVQGYVLTVTGDNDRDAYKEMKSGGSVSFAITDTYKKVTGAVTVTKIWNDDSDRDGVRPDEVTLQLYERASDGNVTPVSPEKKVTLKASEYTGDMWSYTFENLPESRGGVTINYVVRELDPAGNMIKWNGQLPSKDANRKYDVSYEGLTVTNKLDPIKISIPYKKTWKDDNNRDGSRPASIRFGLFKGSKTTPETTVDMDTTNNTHGGAFTGLFQNENGQPVVYTVKEFDTATNKWIESGSFNGNYTASMKKEADGTFHFTNSYTPETYKVIVIKKWDDNGNRDNQRPTELEVTLKANNVDVVFAANDTDPTHKNSAKLTGNNRTDEGWTYTWENLPKNENGRPVSYSVTETLTNGYRQKDVRTTVLRENGKEIGIQIEFTNDRPTDQRTVKVLKVWQDDENRDNARPQNIRVRLTATYKDAANQVQTIDLSKWEQTKNIETELLVGEPNWSYTWNNLPVNYDGGFKINYTVDELIKDANGNYVPGAPAEYKKVIAPKDTDTDGTLTTEFHITNTYEPKLIKVPVEKYWDDAEDQDELRPENGVVVELFANGTSTGLTKELTKANGWKATFESTTAVKLYKFANQKEVEYTIKERKAGGTALLNVGDAYNDDYKVKAYGREAASAADTANLIYAKLTVTNEHKPAETSVKAKKVWADDNNRDKKRPAFVTFGLFADDVFVAQKNADTVEGANESAWVEFNGLALKKNGKVIDYTIKELNAQNQWIGIDELNKANGDVAYNNDYKILKIEKGTDGDATTFTVTNSHEPDKLAIEVLKKWDDSDNGAGLRPNKVKVRLFADGTQMKEAELSEANGWSVKWEDLDVNKQGKVGQAIDYTVTEDAVDKYNTPSITSSEIVNGVKTFTVTNTYDLTYTKVRVKKVWEDGENVDGLRPVTLGVQLYSVKTDAQGNPLKKADGSYEEMTAEGAPVSLSKDTDGEAWYYEWTGLDKIRDGKEVYYVVDELSVPDGYTKVVTGDMETRYIITNTHTPETTEVPVEKVWKDEDNRFGKRPQTIQVQLYADGVPKGTPVTLPRMENGATVWKYTWTDLPVNREGAVGQKITYTVDEVSGIPGYTKVITGDAATGFVITNTIDDIPLTITVKKEWNDGNDQDDVRPEINVQLLADGTVVKTAKLEASNGWTKTWTSASDGIAKYREGEVGQLVVYTVQEVGEANGEIAGKATADGRATTYTVSYSAVPAVSGNDKGVAHDGTMTITNSYTPEKMEIVAVKKWDDEQNVAKKRPATLTFTLWKDGTVLEEKTVTGESNTDKGWTYTWSNLPKYDKGRKINYTVTEGAVKDYTGRAGDPVRTPADENADVNKVTYEFENKYVPGKVDVKVVKNWNDADDQDAVRPGSIQVQLQRRVKNTAGDWADVGDAVTIGKDTTPVAWAHTFAQQDLYVKGQQGQEYEYRVIEVGANVQDNKYLLDAAGERYYTISYSTDTQDEYTTIINNDYTPETVDVIVLKVWDDEENQDGKRPAKVMVQLFADNKACRPEVELNAANGWSYTYTKLPKYNHSTTPIVYTFLEHTMTEGGRVLGGFVENNGDAFMLDSKDQAIYTGTYRRELVSRPGENAEVIDQLIVTNTHVPETTYVLVQKNWDDAQNVDRIRPDEIYIMLYADGVAVDRGAKNDNPEVLKKTHDPAYQQKWSDLPRYKDGKEIKYTVKEGTSKSGTYEKGDAADFAEGAPADYTMTGNDAVTKKDGDGVTYTDVQITNKHEPEGTKVPVVKIWEDAGNYDGLRPTTITVGLFANGVKKATYPLTKDDTDVDGKAWSHMFTNLPVNEIGSDKPITYTIGELKAGGNENNMADWIMTDGKYNDAYDTFVDQTKREITNRHDHEIDKEVRKQNGEWDGEIKLENNNEEFEYKFGTAIPDRKDLKSFVLTDKLNSLLTIVSTEAEIKATLPEKVRDAAEVKIDKATNTVTISWIFAEDDGNGGYNYINQALKAEKVTAVVKAKFTNPDNIDLTADGVVDGKVPNTVRYNIDDEPDHNSDTVWVQPKQEETEVPVTKIWDDAEDYDGIRPDKITVGVFKPETEGSDTLVLAADIKTINASNKDVNGKEWSYKFTGLVKNYPTGNPIPYTIGELKQNGNKDDLNDWILDKGSLNADYQTFVDQTAREITNRHNPKIDKEVKGEGQPDTAYTKEEYAATKAGEVFTYRASTAIPATDMKGDPTVKFEIRDTLTDALVFESTAEQVVVKVGTDVVTGTNRPAVAIDDDTKTLTVTFEGTALENALNKAVSVEFQASIDPEADLTQYIEQTEGKIPNDVDYIINLNDPVPSEEVWVKPFDEKIDIPVKKIWEDANNYDDIRPKNITVGLFRSEDDNIANATLIASQQITGTGKEWSHTFKEQPKRQQNGKLYHYFVGELKDGGLAANAEDWIKVAADGNYNDAYATTVDQTAREITNRHDHKIDKKVKREQDPDYTEDVKLEDNAENFEYQINTAIPDRKDLESFVITDKIHSLLTIVSTDAQIKATLPAAVRDAATVAIDKTTNTVTISWTFAEDDGNGGYNYINQALKGVKVTAVVKAKFTNPDNIDLTANGVVAGKVPNTVRYNIDDEDDVNSNTVWVQPKQEETEVPVTKIWDDANNKDNVRPGNITVGVFAPKEQGSDELVLLDSRTIDENNKVASDDNKWSYEFTGLVKSYANGALIPYTIGELKQNGNKDNLADWIMTSGSLNADYQTFVDQTAREITNRHNPKIDKEVKGENDPATKYSKEDYALTKAGEKFDYRVSTAIPATDIDGNPTEKFEITDELTEALVFESTAAQVVVKVAGTETNATNRPAVKIEGKKLTVTFENDALANALGKAVTVEFRCSIDPTADLTKYVEEMEGKIPNDVEYRINLNDPVPSEEVWVKPFTEKIDIPVIKVWEDAENYDNIRPAIITVGLFVGDELKETKQIKITDKEVDGKAWSVKFTDLDKKYANSKDIPYVVKEQAADGTWIVLSGNYNDGYKATVTGDKTKGYTITNSHDSKIEKDINGKTEYEVQTPEEAFTYTIKTAITDKLEAKSFTIEDTLEGVLEFVSKEAEVTVSPAGADVSISGQTLTVHFDLADEDGDDTNGVQNALKGQTVTISFQAKFVKDPDMTPYTTGKVPNHADYKIDNTFTQRSEDVYVTPKGEKIDIPVEKIWIDADDYDGIRPTVITVGLFIGDELLETKQITPEGEDGKAWSVTFKDLLKNNNDGSAKAYVVKELRQNGVQTNAEDWIARTGAYNDAYVSEVEGSKEAGYKITNTHDHKIVKDVNGTTDYELAQPDEAFKYTVKTAITDKVEAKSFTITDTLEPVLEFVVKDANATDAMTMYGISVTPAGATVTVSGKTLTVIYTLNDEDNDDTNGVQNALKGQKVTISFDAKVMANADLTPYHNGTVASNGKVPNKATYTIDNDFTQDSEDVYVFPKEERIDIPVVKRWEDAGNYDQIRPIMIVFGVFKGDELVEAKEVRMTDAEVNGQPWSRIFKGLLKNELDGTEITYTIGELKKDGDKDNAADWIKAEGALNDNYRIIVDNDEREITNRHDHEIDKKVKVANGTWEGKVELEDNAETFSYQFKTAIPDRKELNTFVIKDTLEELLVFDGSEDDVVIEPQAAADLATVTIVDGRDLTISWTFAEDDGNGGYNYINQELKGTNLTITVNAKFENPGQIDMTKTVAGSVPNKVRYQIDQEPEKSSDDVFVTPRTDYIRIPVEKKWLNDADKKNLRPGSITIGLFKRTADGDEEVYVTDITQRTEWKYEFGKKGNAEGKLPLKEDDGSLITYVVKEQDAAGNWIDVSGTYDDVYTVTITTGAVEDDTEGQAGDKVQNVEIANTAETNEITVEKVWDDDDNRDGVRDTVVWVGLFRTIGGVEVDDEPYMGAQRLRESNNWRYTWKNLPLSENGEKITYVVKEMRKSDDEWITSGEYNENYTLTSGTKTETQGEGENKKDVEIRTLTNTHIPEPTDVPVEKTWDDFDNADGVRPQTVKVQLYADGEKLTGSYTPKTIENGQVVEGTPIAYEQTLTADENGKWSFVWTGLPKYAKGKKGVEVKYTVDETEIAGYDKSIEGNVINNRLLTTTVTVKKVWDDKEDQDGVRPNGGEVTVRLYKKNGDDLVRVREAEEVVLRQGNDYSYTWKDLPQYENEALISYVVVEMDGDTEAGDIMTGLHGKTYSVTYGPVEGSAKDGYETVITNTYVPEVVDVEAEKIWDDMNNKDKIRDAEITLTLFANGKEVTVDQDGKAVENPVKINESNKWKAEWKNLPKYGYGEHADPIRYTVEESGLHESYTHDSNNPVDYKLVKLNAEGNEAADNDAIEKYAITIWNRYIPDQTQYKVVKIWDDADNQDGFRDTVYVQLYMKDETGKVVPVEPYEYYDVEKDEDGKVKIENGMIVREQNPTRAETLVALEKPALDTDARVSHTWVGLPKNHVGKKTVIEYSVKEVTVKEENGELVVDEVLENDAKLLGGEYTVTYGESDTYSQEITNKHTPYTTRIRIAKTWADANDYDELRPDTIRLQITGTADVVVDDEGNTYEKVYFWNLTKDDLEKENVWVHIFDNEGAMLPVYVKGEKITYTVKEVDVPEGYKSKLGQIEDDADEEDLKLVAIDNAHNPPPKKTIEESEKLTKIAEDKAILKLRENEFTFVIEAAVPELMVNKNDEVEELSKFVIADKVIDDIDIVSTEDEVIVDGVKGVVEIDGQTLTVTYEGETLEKAKGTKITVKFTGKLSETADISKYLQSGIDGFPNTAEAQFNPDDENGVILESEPVTITPPDPEIEKEVALADDSEGEVFKETVEFETEKKELATHAKLAARDEEVTYTVRTKIPERDIDSFVITDEVVPELEILSIEDVTVGGNVVDKPKAVEEDNKITVSFTDKAYLQANGGKEVVLTFTAKIVDGADISKYFVQGKKGVPNDAGYEYLIGNEPTTKDSNEVTVEPPDPEIDKTVQADGVENAEGKITFINTSDDTRAELLSKDESFTYTIETTLPESLIEKFVISDTIKPVLDFVSTKDTVKVMLIENGAEKNAEATVAINGQTLSVSFAKAFLNNNAGKTVKVSFQARVKANASAADLKQYVKETGIENTAEYEIDDKIKKESEPAYVIPADPRIEKEVVNSAKESFRNKKKHADLSARYEIYPYTIYTEMPERKGVVSFTVTDTLEDVLHFISEEKDVVVTVGGETAPYADVTVDPATRSLTVKFDGADVEGHMGEEVKITFQAQFNEGADLTKYLQEVDPYKGLYPEAPTKELERIPNEASYEIVLNDNVTRNVSTRRDWVAQRDAEASGKTITRKSDVVTVTPPEELNIKVKKVWNDADNHQGRRPSEIKVKLYQNGALMGDYTYIDEQGQEQKVATTVTLNEANQWSDDSWVHLPKYAKGTKTLINYTVVEDEVEAYQPFYGDPVPTADGFEITITNKYDPEKTYVTVMKRWIDGDNRFGTRPAGITAVLQANGKEQARVELNAANSFMHTWNDLDKFMDGKEVVYTVVEAPVPEGYEVNITKSNATTFVITNTVQTGTLIVNKVATGLPAGTNPSYVFVIRNATTGEQVASLRVTGSGSASVEVAPGSYIVEELGANESTVRNYSMVTTGSGQTVVVRQGVTTRADIINRYTDETPPPQREVPPDTPINQNPPIENPEVLGVRRTDSESVLGARRGKTGDKSNGRKVIAMFAAGAAAMMLALAGRRKKKDGDEG